MNEKLLAGPALDRALTGTSSGQTSTTSTAPTAAVAAVAGVAGSNAGTSAPATASTQRTVDAGSPFQNGRLAIERLGGAAPVTAQPAPCPTATINAIAACVDQLSKDAVRDTGAAKAAFGSLSMLSDVDIGAAASFVDGFLATHPLDTEKARADFNSAVTTDLLRANGPVDQLKAEFRNLLPYPFQSLAADDARATALQQGVMTLQGLNKQTLKLTDSQETQLTILAKAIADVQSNLGQWDDKSQNGKAYVGVLNKVSGFFKSTVNTLQPSSFYSVRAEPCSALIDSSKQTTVEIDVGPDSSTVVVNCASRIFVSSGFAFSSLPQRTYSAVTQNPLVGTTPVTPPATPAPTPGPFAVIVDTNVSQIRPIPAVLANVRLTDSSNPLYGSFGVTLSSSSTSSVFDYLGGLSYSLDRTLTLTGGVHLGQVTELASGYHLGDAIAPGSAPQTTNRLKTGFFLGITFGNH